MLNKLSLRNARRSASDYLIYLVTMTIVSSLMFAFHGMIFSSNIQSLYAEFGVFAALIGVASFFVVLIIIWLVHYIVRFMMEKRSREFGTYMLLGMTKKQISRIFRRENLILGIISMVLGILPGIFFQLIFTNVFYSILETDTRIYPELSIWNILLTCGLLLFAYTWALARVKKNFRRMNIHDLMYAEKKNEEIRNDSSRGKSILTTGSLLCIVIFNILVLTTSMTMTNVFLFTAGLIAAIYLLYIGLSSFFVSYLKRGGPRTEHNANTFILRQLASKIKTMRFTMGTLTILFTGALLAWTVVMMFADYQRSQLGYNNPFDIIVFSDQPDDRFEEQLEVIHDAVSVQDSWQYQIYENKTAAVNEYLYDHVDGTYREDRERVSDDKYGYATYFAYDTYIALSDYNYIRRMLGYEEVSLAPGSYLLHGKERLASVLEDVSRDVTVLAGSEELQYQGIYTEGLSQDGMNGADYLIVIADGLISQMTPYYALLAVSAADSVPAGLQEALLDTQDYEDSYAYILQFDIIWGAGSDTILSAADTVLVADNVAQEMTFLIVTMCYMLAYLGIVFLCAALTILAIQQLSDSSKYKFRYQILRNLGLNRRETDQVVLKQLGIYYLCPYVISILLSMCIGMFASERFVYYTGAPGAIFQYYILAVLVFTVLYLIYFAVTYLGFLKNIKA